MVVDTKLYDLLGVSPTASDSEIKRAYKKKALELHPDKNKDDPQATEKFQSVNEAYEILKDPEKRDAYDRYGPESLKGESGDAGYDIFSHLFGFGGFPGFSFGARSSRPRRTADIEYTVNLSLEELYTGCDRVISIQKQCLCPNCKGNGTSSGKQPSQCRACNGTGNSTKVYRHGNTEYREMGLCAKCQGTGMFLPEKDKCHKCRGEKTVMQVKQLSVHVPPGMGDGEQIVMQGESNELPDCETGNLIVTIIEEKHSLFTRNHENLMFNKKISITEAFAGYKFTLPTLDGRTLVIEQHEKITMHGDVICIQGEGMPKESSRFDRGNLFIRFFIKFPKRNEVPPQVIEVLKQYMPVENPTIDENDENIFHPSVCPSSLGEFQKSQKKKKHERRREAYQNDSDDDSEQSSGTGCQPM